MATYVTLIKFTDQGIRTVKDTVKRAEQGASLAERLGGRLTSIHWTQGAYDIVAIAEFPDEDGIQTFLLSLGTQGNIRTETLRAFSAQDMQRIISKLP
jgi:uncharacterized protein with GYD domain